MTEPSSSVALRGPDLSTEPDEQVLYDGRGGLVPSIGALFVAIVTVGLGLVYFWLKRLDRHYRITTQRVVIEHGILSKRLEQIDIYRITDYVVERPFGQRLMGTGNLLLKSMDLTTPEIKLDGLKTDVVVLYEKLRRATESEKRRRGVRVIDYDEHP
ncbi:PH domain-containing protein [Myxococcota bacterium]